MHARSRLSLETVSSNSLNLSRIKNNILTNIPGIGPEISAAVQKIFATAKVPIEWEAVDVTPVRNPDGRFGIPQAAIDSVNRNQIGLKGPLMTPGINLDSSNLFNILLNIKLQSVKVTVRSTLL